MILYVNGDSHTAAAEAVNTHAFAEDDSRYFYMGRAPHPENIAVSWGRLLADTLTASFHCDAESASSNQRIIRTTRQWINSHPARLKEVLMVIQWSTWERQEWLIDGTYYQVNASGIDQVPESAHQRYKEFVAGVDWKTVTEQAHNEIWDFHQELEALGIPHVFFNGNNHFGSIAEHKDWGVSYIDPYNPGATFDSWLKTNNFDTVSPASWHFGKQAHSAWKRFVLQYIFKHNLSNV
jgi:hypothetical protein